MRKPQRQLVPAYALRKNNKHIYTSYIFFPSLLDIFPFSISNIADCLYNNKKIFCLKIFKYNHFGSRKWTHFELNATYQHLREDALTKIYHLDTYQQRLAQKKAG